MKMLVCISQCLIVMNVAAKDVSQHEIPIFVKGEKEVVIDYMKSVNEALGKKQLGGEWELLLEFEDDKVLNKFKKLCPECIDVDPIPEVPVVSPTCDTLHQIAFPKSLKLTSNTSYISEKVTLFMSKGVLMDVDVKYTTMFPKKDVKSLDEVFKDCLTCIDVDPVPIVPVVSPSGDPCK
ncbi:hypothetical protein A7985_03950 [Pseudoalteromonas luteoviolacea]|uniref:Uncharacterized protein n=1 Tax=Pseudoalteromonas luteoviolacea TaxID=43657 RepID=A0A1C0TUX2_9GAMM|nr:hypothetical protein [Pseudoalteromonas luteoviolacea]OCQ23111.1 hypothetical protein A7985_03950 [Pseudoalteromonas luteoviolacea]